MLGKDKSRLTPIKRLFRTTFSVFILTAFILGIAFFVRNLSSVDTSRLVSLASPVLEKLGLSPGMIKAIEEAPYPGLIRQYV